VRGKLLLLALVVLAPAMALAASAEATKPKQQAAQARVLNGLATPAMRQPRFIPKQERVVRLLRIKYRAHDGVARRAYVILPIWYSRKNNPPLPFVISPHGRGVSARTNARLWGALPARGSFAVISPEGAGRKFSRYSWGAQGQIRDLARMPQIARRALPWLRINARRIYAVGGSMGGQETLLLVARHPKLLAGAAAFDSVTDFARQYRSFTRISCGKACRRTWKGHIGTSLQAIAKAELGGSPRTNPAAYALRSPMTYVRRLASSCVPLQLWWSMSDRVVLNQRWQSGELFRRIMSLNPKAPVEAYVGYWSHSVEMHAQSRLPAAIAAFGLLQPQPRRLTSGLHFTPPPKASTRCGQAAPKHPPAKKPTRKAKRAGS
jgi:pimeloyl-ACP methyl ester carboxylesterase